jgi:iron complex outermembrane receptor protein
MKTIALHGSVAVLALIAATPARAADRTAADEATADAADAEYSAEPIVVTARHREEQSQDVPVAISVVDSGALERTGNFTLNQIQQLVPSLQIASFNPRNSNINIRGLGANSSISVDGLEYGVGFYLDGVYYGRPAQSQFDLVDLAQIEVLRGPQGTLFGKNTTAGAINVTSREPSFDPELTAEGSLGNHDYHQVRLSASAPIVADKVAVRLSLADTHRGGFLLNRYDFSKAQDYDNFSIRGQVLIKPADDVKIRLIGDYSRQKQHASLSLIDGYYTTYADGTPIANSFLDRVARFGYTPASSDAFDRVGDANSPFRANMKSYGVSGQVDWDLGPVTLTSITAYRWWDWDPQNDIDATSLSVNTIAETRNRQRQFSQELRVASNGHHTIDYQFGLFYFWQVVRGYARTGYGKDFAAWNLPASTPAATLATLTQALTGIEADSYSDPRTKSYAAFGQADWHITDALTLTAGLRYTHEDKQGSFTRFLAPNSGGNIALLTDAQKAQFQLSDLSFSAKTKADALTGLVTLGYKITPDVLVYGTYSRGNKSGGLNVTAGGIVQPVVNPEKVDSFELGLKSQFLDRRLTANLAAFYTQIRDYQANVSLQVGQTTATTQYIANIPKVRSQGVEADLAFAPTDRLSFTASAAYTDAKFIDYRNAPQRTELTIPGTLPIQDLSGRRLPGVSKFAYSLSADASQPVGASLEAYGHADYLHRSSFNSNASLSIYGVVPAYGVLNGRIGLRTSDGVYDFSFWVRNLTNEKYYTSRGPGVTIGVISGSVGDPRTFGATLRAKW